MQTQNSEQMTQELTDPPSRPLLLSHPPTQPSAHPAPALVAHAQGGITLGPGEGELDADFCSLGKIATNLDVMSQRAHCPKNNF
jgi:hypothetical protein